VAGAHGCSHFYQLVLPPLFPFITASLGIGFEEAGVLIACFYAASGLAQTPSGFLVDRFGARRVLLSGLALAVTSVTFMSLLASQSGILESPRPARSTATALLTKPPSASTLALLVSPAILLCFGYFFLLSVSLTGNQTFMPAALNQLYDTPLATAGAALSAYLLAGSFGILVGGIAADRTSRHEGIVAAGLLGAAVIMLVVGFVRLPDPAIVAAVALAGFASGSTTPSRDMLVRGATPAGATGKV